MNLESRIESLSTALASAGDLVILLATELSAKGCSSEAGDLLVRIGETLGAELAKPHPFAAADRYTAQSVLDGMAEERQILTGLQLAEQFEQPELPSIELALRTLREVPHNPDDPAALKVRDTASRHITTALQIVVVGDGWSLQPNPE